MLNQITEAYLGLNLLTIFFMGEKVIKARIITILNYLSNLEDFKTFKEDI